MTSRDVYAQTDSTTSTTQTVPSQVAPRREAIQNALERRETLQEKKGNFQDRLTGKRAQVQEKIQVRKEALKQKLETIVDTRKKLLVERIDAKISTVNETVTNRMSAHLEKLSSILTRLTEKAANLKTEGKDTSALDGAITLAQTAVGTAKTAVETQAAKDYNISVVDEATLRSTVGAAMSQFRLDLNAVHKLIIDAKQVVSKAATELARLKNRGVIPTTASGAAQFQPVVSQ